MDPSRLLYHNNNNNNNNLLVGFNKPINKLQEDIIINNLSLHKVQPKQLSSTDDDISLQFLPKNNKNQLVPITNNYNNHKTYNRFVLYNVSVNCQILSEIRLLIDLKSLERNNFKFRVI